VRITRAVTAHAGAALAGMLRFDAPADMILSRYFRNHRRLGQAERAFIAEAVFAVLRRKRSLEAAAGSANAEALLAAALMRVQGLSARALEGVFDESLLRKLRQAPRDELPAAIRADLPDWLWERLTREQGADEALRIAQGLLNPAPLDLRVNLARIDRSAAQAELAAACTLPRRHTRPQDCGLPENLRSIATGYSQRAWSRCKTKEASCSPGCSRRGAAR
jgi:16S rRNA (cytosine967-C5)-methyltransferase